jgi:hypothetical protein
MIYLFEEIYIKTNINEKSIEELLEDAKKAYTYLLDGERFQTKKGTPVRFNQRGFNEFFYSVENVMNDNINGKAATKLINRNKHNIDELLATVANLQEIVENMDFQFYQKNKKPEAKPFLRGIEYYECPVVINGKHRKVKLAFEKNFKDRDKNANYYYHFLEQKQQIHFEIVITNFELI